MTELLAACRGRGTAYIPQTVIGTPLALCPDAH